MIDHHRRPWFGRAVVGDRAAFPDGAGAAARTAFIMAASIVES
jgi:hypothetical protein